MYCVLIMIKPLVDKLFSSLNKLDKSLLDVPALTGPR